MGLNPLPHLRGAFTISLFTLNVVFWFIPIIFIGLAKLLIPVQGWRDLMSRWLSTLGENWISCNGLILGLTQSITWDVEGNTSLARRGWYLVISNHQSWVDILVLQKVFNRRIPFLKFFIKQQLIWVPFLGLAWWAMDMPFMRRFSREYLAKHPEMRGKDLEATRTACEKFERIPTSIINFVEGTRVTPAKQRERESPYRHLLPPRAGGIAFVLGAMGDTLHDLLDVSIVYPGGAPSMWDLCCGKLRCVVVRISSQPIEPWLLQGDYQDNDGFRLRFQQWLAQMWSQKDGQIDVILEQEGKRHPMIRRVS